jgi:uncharacterized RDD family membrane protein YckC
MAQIQTAKFSRRLVAIFIDWAMASVISAGFFKWDSTATLVIYAIMQVLLVGTLGYSVGHRFMKLAVVRIDGGRVGLWRALIRTSLIVLVIPAFIWDTRDGRGLQDKAVGTAIIRV